MGLRMTASSGNASGDSSADPGAGSDSAGVTPAVTGGEPGSASPGASAPGLSQAASDRQSNPAASVQSIRFIQCPPPMSVESDIETVSDFGGFHPGRQNFVKKAAAASSCILPHIPPNDKPKAPPAAPEGPSSYPRRRVAAR